MGGRIEKLEAKISQLQELVVSQDAAIKLFQECRNRACRIETLQNEMIDIQKRKNAIQKEQIELCKQTIDQAQVVIFLMALQAAWRGT